ncbi:hypothetical protein BC936DRAFT_141641, partial [Jimgerdemannia flammicorona]
HFCHAAGDRGRYPQEHSAVSRHCSDQHLRLAQEHVRRAVGTREETFRRRMSRCVYGSSGIAIPQELNRIPPFCMYEQPPNDHLGAAIEKALSLALALQYATHHQVELCCTRGTVDLVGDVGG